MRNTEIKLKTAFDNVPICVLTLNQYATISYINKTGLKLINKKQEEVLGKHFGDSFNCIGSYKDLCGCGCGPMCVDCELKKATSLAFKSGQPSEDIEINKQLLIDGKEVSFWFKMSVTPIISGNNKNAVLTLLDITEKKKEELSLIQSRDYGINLLNQIPSMVWRMNADLQCEYVNVAWESFTGLKIEEALGNGLAKVIHPDDLNLYNKVIVEANQKRGPFQIEVRLRRNDGVYRCCLISGTPYYDLNGQFDGYIGNVLDITDSKKVIESLNRYQQLAEITDDIILFIDMDGRIVDANRAAVKAYGYTYEELLSINIRDIRSDWGYTKMQMGVANKTGIFFEAVHRRKDGSHFDVEVSSRGTDMDNRRILVSIVRDITERKLMDQKLREQEELFRTIFEQSPIGIGVCSSNGEIIDANTMFERIFGRSKAELKRLGWHNITYPEDLYKDAENFTKYKNGQLKTYKTIKRYIKSDNSVVWGSLTLAPILIENNAKKLNIAMVEDITEHIQAEEALKKSESKHKAMVDNISDVIAITDENFNVKYISPNIKKIFGWDISDILNASLWNKIHANDVERIQQELFNLFVNDNSEKTVEFNFRCRDGNYKIVELTVKNLIKDKDINGLLLTYRDITVRRGQEEEIRFLNFHDVLTGLYNRRFFENKKKIIDRKKYLPISVILCDINGVKFTNEALGQEQGNNLIISVAKVLKSCVRDQDILARVGGDDFCILLPNTGYAEACKIMKQIVETYDNQTGLHTSISLGCATKTHPSENFNEILKLAEDNMHQQKLLQHESSHSALIASMKVSLYEKSQETEEHAQRLVKLSKVIGQKLNLSEKQLNELELLAMLHDIGKIAINENILNKPDKLTDAEWAMKKHSEIGYRIAMASNELKSISNYILHHHERLDGKGYPKGLKGNNIPLLSRIIAVVDSFDAMTEDRAYRKAMTRDAAIEEIKRNAGTQFDPEIVRIFLETLENSN